MARTAQSTLPQRRLKELREWRRLPVGEAARAVSVTPTELEALENGSKGASASVLRKLSEAYAVPLSQIYAETPQELTPPLPDFRTVQNVTAEYTSYLVRAIAWADEIARFTKFLASSGSEPIALPPQLESNNINGTARQLEQILSFGSNFRLSELSTLQVIKHVRKELGDLGIVVLQDSINDQTCKGFCFSDDLRAPTIVINTRNQGTYEARLFTLIHEACHVFFRHEGIVDPYSQTNSFESFCNAVTAEFLAPTSEFLPFAADKLRAGGSPGNSDIKRIAARFRLSQQATALRLEQLGIANKGFYNAWLKQFEGIPFPDQTGGGGGGTRPEEGVIKLAKYGHYFILSCAEAIEKKQISEIDVFHVCRLKPQYFWETVAAARAFVAEVTSYGQP